MKNGREKRRVARSGWHAWGWGSARSVVGTCHRIQAQHEAEVPGTSSWLKLHGQSCDRLPPLPPPSPLPQVTALGAADRGREDFETKGHTPFLSCLYIIN